MRISICVTTHDRKEIVEDTIGRIRKLQPEDSEVIIVDDASEIPISISSFIFSNNVGIARAKNKCLELSKGEHIFLFDDDCYPIAKDWWKPYVESQEPHLMYQFRIPGKGSEDMKEVYRDDKIVAYTNTRGAMIYLHRKVLESVGGFDTKYGIYGYEHPDLTNRIFNAGLTNYRAMDVPGSESLLYCLDQDGKVESSVPKEKRTLSIRSNRQYYKSNKGLSTYKEYKQA